METVNDFDKRSHSPLCVTLSHPVRSTKYIKSIISEPGHLDFLQ